MCFKILKEILGKYEKPVSLGRISYEEIKKLLSGKSEKEGVIYLNPTKLYILDEHYDLCSLLTVSKFLNQDNISFQRFREIYNDCDEFASQLWGRLNEWAPSFAFGFAMSSSHAFNIFIDNEKRVWIIEPQNDKIISLEKAKSNSKYYPLKMVLI